jgi:hypothetical protein
MGQVFVETPKEGLNTAGWFVGYFFKAPPFKKMWSSDIIDHG